MIIFIFFCTICSASTNSVSEYAEKLGVDENFKLLGENDHLFYQLGDQCSENFRVTDIKDNGLSQEIEILAAIEFLTNQTPVCVRTFINRNSMMKKALGIEQDESCMGVNVNNGPTACNTFDTSEMKWIVSIPEYQGNCLEESTSKLHLCERSGYNCGDVWVPTIGWKKTVKDQETHQLESTSVTDIDQCINLCGEKELCDLIVYSPFAQSCVLIKSSWSEGLSCNQIPNAYSEGNSVTVKVKSTQHEDFCYIGIHGESCKIETTTVATTSQTTTSKMTTAIKSTTESEIPMTTPIPIIFATPSTPPPTFAPTTITISTTIGVIGTTTTGSW